MDRKSKYCKKGTYSGYKKNNKERAALDYYSTPTEEVVNILQTMKEDNLLDIRDTDLILEPSCGGLHMVKGINTFFDENNISAKIIASDVQERDGCIDFDTAHFGDDYDFLSDDYPFIDNIDYIIMNPPYSTIEPFTMKSLGIAKKGVLLLGRLQFLEGESRFNKIFAADPPSDVYVYVDRIACYKNGDLSIKDSSAQAYAWFYWDLTTNKKDTIIHWLRRSNKK